MLPFNYLIKTEEDTQGAEPSGPLLWGMEQSRAERSQVASAWSGTQTQCPQAAWIWEKGHRSLKLPEGAPRDPAGAQGPPRMDCFSLRAIALADTQHWFSLLGLTTC